ncbi:MAG: succinate dehydrogenase [Gammaproteobacteria bacterium]|nr:succinate dehydrogenase [Gammaproteobacteria bacterium]
MLSPRLFIAQRVTALLLAPFVLGHLAGIICAVHGGLDAAEILARTRGNPWLAAFYQLFVVLAAFHAAIGVRVICAEFSRGRLREIHLDIIATGVGLTLLCMGGFAVVAVVV